MSPSQPAGYEDFFDQGLIPDALSLLLDAWDSLPRPDPEDKEDKITECIASRMKTAKKSRRLPFTIHFQVIPLDDQGAVAARIDFALLSGFNEDAYLGFECKRLRIPHVARLDYNTDDYVGSEGMGRFASGKYAPTQMHGVMVGYVMDGKVSNAMKSVFTRIQREQAVLGLLSAAWETSTFLPSETGIRQTRHQFSKPTRKAFCFQHVFLAV